MAGPKRSATKKKRSAKPAAPKKAAARSRSLEKQAARDVYVGPSAKRIDRSLDQGTKQTLEFFRSRIDWS
jgi:hypothetical protein